MKIRSKYELFEFIGAELSWRRHEMTNMRAMVEGSRRAQQKLAIRSSIVMMYSHWEGFVKNTAKAFLYYLNSQGYKYSQLKSNFSAVGIINVAGGENSQINTQRAALLYDFLMMQHANETFSVDADKYVNTKSNLNSEVLKEILYKLGIPEKQFATYYVILDSSLLKRRNEIAHGENTEARADSALDLDGFILLYEKTFELITLYKSEIENHIYTDGFLSG
ncbi:MAE_28990/MAE_18760 family HEPN-like nuclease [Aeromonas enteropelogenes]|uniref:MAE_28990/MAE_18760 family HEPN-like nuclease n=1 Tax=Aeromonas enteropelogenes TaxID=29489 RepID=UPI0038D10528